jgi:uncharacterized coiled-coil protein SlyX
MDEMTIGEITRSLARLEKSQAEQTTKLDEIKTQTVKTNGYVGRHEVRLDGLDREVRDLKRAPVVEDHSLTRVSDRTDAMTLTIPNKVIKSVIAFLILALASAVASYFGLKLPL